MCSSRGGRHAAILILCNPLLAISTDESAVIKAPYVSTRDHPHHPHHRDIQLFMSWLQLIERHRTTRKHEHLITSDRPDACVFRPAAALSFLLSFAALEIFLGDSCGRQLVVDGRRFRSTAPPTTWENKSDTYFFSTGQKSHSTTLTSGFCVQCANINSAFTPGSTDSAADVVLSPRLGFDLDVRPGRTHWIDVFVILVFLDY